jgi:hypothetical protein
MMPREGMLIDPKCHDLAVHFLNPDATDAMKTELAEWIQWHVELWLYDDKDGAKEAAEQLGDPELSAD